MARSRRKNPCTAIGTSDRWWKKKYNRKLRLAVKNALRREDDVMPIVRELSDVWDSSKDYKGYWPKPHDSEACQRMLVYGGLLSNSLYFYYASVEYWERQAFRK